MVKKRSVCPSHCPEIPPWRAVTLARVSSSSVSEFHLVVISVLVLLLGSPSQHGGHSSPLARNAAQRISCFYPCL